MSPVKGFGALERLRRGWAVVAPVGRGVPRAPAPGVEQPSLRCRRMCVSADSWVRAAMIRSAPRRHKGHVATVEMYGEVKPAAVTSITAEAQVGVPHDSLGLLDIVIDHRKSGKIPNTRTRRYWLAARITL